LNDLVENKERKADKTMKKALMLCLVVMMSVVFTGLALAYNEIGTNTYLGEYAGNAGGGSSNSSFGYNAGASLTGIGYMNTFMGGHAGASNTTGYRNTFIGYQAGYYNTTGDFNNFIGYQAGLGQYTQSTGNDNNIIGYQAGYANTTGNSNNFMGTTAGYANTTGYHNDFIGYQAGYANTTGHYNTFLGNYAGHPNTTGSYNISLGYYAGHGNTTGEYNIFIGSFTGGSETEGNYNTLIGYSSGINSGLDAITNATAIGNKAFVSQSNSLVLGSINGVNGATSNVNVGIGTSFPARQLHIVGDNAVFRMDRPYDTAAFMLVRTDGSGNPLKTFVVGANASGSNTGEFVINDLGTAVSGAGTTRLRIANNGVVYVQSLVQTSSLALKDNIRTYANALETVTRLRGVKFNWKDSKTPSVGLIAEEVEKVVPEVVAHANGAAGINYSALVGVLVEAVKEQETKLEKQQNLIQAQQAELDTLKKQQGLIQEQQKSIVTLSQKVSQLEHLLILSKTMSKAD
jgi:hypothetical protein